jgi:hypothetical protein
MLWGGCSGWNIGYSAGARVVLRLVRPLFLGDGTGGAGWVVVVGILLGPEGVGILGSVVVVG